MSVRDDQRGYQPWRPTTTQALLDNVMSVFEEYPDHRPLTIRQVFYRLVGAHGFEKSEAAYARLLYLLDRARRARMLTSTGSATTAFAATTTAPYLSMGGR